jgi:hypothetical protein
LNGANLTEAGLPQATLRKADLRLAIFSAANLRGASLIDADLRSANLHGSDLRDTDFSRADLRCVKFTVNEQTQVEQANFDDTLGLTKEQQSQLIARSARCDVISSDRYIDGFTRKDIADRLWDLREGIETFGESIDQTRQSLILLNQPDCIPGDSVESERIQRLEKFIGVMDQVKAQLLLDVEEYSTSLYDLDWTADELLEEYENINIQIFKVSAFKRTIDQIYVDLPGFIKRS